MSSKTTRNDQGAGSQIERFREAARELETDQSEEAFDRIVEKVARMEPKADVEPKFVSGDRVSYKGSHLNPRRGTGAKGIVTGPDAESGAGPAAVMVRFDGEKDDTSVHCDYLEKLDDRLREIP